jgi:Signal transduction histidine kinase
MANTYIIIIKSKNPDNIFRILLLINICSISILQYYSPGVTSYIYAYTLLNDIFKERKSIIKFFLSIHFVLFFLVLYLNLIRHNDLTPSIDMSIMGFVLLSYIGLSGMLYSIRKLEIEKEEVKQLNEKLKSANMKLQEYALQVEEMTVTRERTKVAQELHDSLGHSLMALSMHLEFAKKICTAKPDKVEEVLTQSEKIAKSSINDLRKAVTLLNSEIEINDFDNSIENLINNFYLLSNLKINYAQNISINNLTPLIKTSIYKTIQECVTNSLKHGNAKEISIKIKVANENIEVIITDNGIGCNNIVKSTGLNGIENRISSLDGKVYYFSHDNLGFGIKLSIPI